MRPPGTGTVAVSVYGSRADVPVTVWTLLAVHTNRFVLIDDTFDDLTDGWSRHREQHFSVGQVVASCAIP